jgi:hypothetical protein
MLQFCEWHVAENLKKILAKEKYKKDDGDLMMDLVWRYIWSATEEDLEKNGATMTAAMRPPQYKPEKAMRVQISCYNIQELLN